ncbi:MAG: hypothetical protein IPJ17_15275 [Holophagales bacterium]|nr:MAG: hypothetical protein IPJ17_15275 [Holophagales bacterium]
MERSTSAEGVVGKSTTNRFGFVMHPLTVDYVQRHRALRWTRHLPRPFVERMAARLPALEVGSVRGGISPETGQAIQGYLFSIGATPRQMLTRPPAFTYARLNQAARRAAARGAGILGLGAFTKVVGDAGITVAREAPIPVTTGNSLTISATLETAKVAAKRLGWPDLGRGRAMVVGATGAIGSVCARLLATAVKDVVLVSIEPERLEALRGRILQDQPDARVEIDLTTHRWVGECDLIVTATSAFGQRVLDISECKPGAVVLDVALPPDLSAEEAALRPDVLVIESGEVLIPGPVHFSFDIGLPQGVAYACLAESALLAMEGRFECFTLGRDIELEKVKEIYRLFRRHGFGIAPLRSFGRLLTDELLVEKRGLAEALLADPGRLAAVRAEARSRLKAIPPRSKGVPATTVPAPAHPLAATSAG